MAQNKSDKFRKLVVGELVIQSKNEKGKTFTIGIGDAGGLNFSNLSTANTKRFVINKDGTTDIIAPNLSLSSNKQLFTFDGNTSALDPVGQNVVLTAVLTGDTGTLTFSAVNNSGQKVTLVEDLMSNNKVTLRGTDFASASSVTVTAKAVTNADNTILTDTVVISKVVSGETGATGAGGTDAKVVKLTSNDYQIAYDADGLTPDPAVGADPTFTAVAQNHEGVAGTNFYYHWYVGGAWQSVTPGSGNTAAPSIVVARKATYGNKKIVKVETRTGSTQGSNGSLIASDSVAVIATKQGSDAIIITGDNLSHALIADNSGGVAGSGEVGSGIDFDVYVGNIQLTANSTATDFAGLGTGASAANTYGITAVGSNSISVGAKSRVNSNKTLRFAAHSNFPATQSSVVYSIFVRDKDGNNRGTFTQTQTFSLSKEGDVGTTGASNNIVFKRSASNPNAPNASAGVPTGWDDSPGDSSNSNGTDLLWASKGTKAVGASTFSWTTPYQVEGTAVAEINVYKKSASDPGTPTGGSYNLSTSALSVSGLTSGWQKTLPAISSNGDKVWQSVGLFSGSPTDTAATTTWSSAVLYTQRTDGNTGQTGASNNIVFKRNAANPGAPSATSGVPSGWDDSPGATSNSNGTATLWAMKGTKAAGGSTFSWTTPYQVEGSAVAEIPIYKKNDNTIADNTAGSYNFVTNTLTPPSGWSKDIQTLSSDGDIVYQSVGLFSGSPAETAATTTWATPVKYAQRTDGDDGSNAKLVKLIYDKQAFTYGSNGSASPANQVISITGSLQNTTATDPTWTITEADGDAFTNYSREARGHATATNHYHESFEGLSDGSTSNPATNGTWTNGLGSKNGTDVDNAFSWVAEDTDANSAGTGPDNAHSGSMYVFTEGSGRNNKWYAMQRQFTSDQSKVVAKMSFVYHMYGAVMGNIKVWGSTNGSDWTQLSITKDVDGSPSSGLNVLNGQQHSAEDEAYKRAEVDLRSYYGSAFYVRITGYTGGSSFTSDASIDAISFIPYLHPTAIQITDTQFASNTLLKVKATADGLDDEVTLVKLSDGAVGADAITCILTNESHTLQTSTAGVVTYTDSGTEIKVFKGTTELDSVTATPSTGQFKVTAAVVNINAPTIGASQVSGNPVVIGDFTSMTADQAKVTYTINVENTVSLTKIQSFSKSKAGSTGASNNIVFARSAAAPATPNASAGVPNSPIQWYDNPPSGTDLLWASKGTKAVSAINFSWETPYQVEGTAVAEVSIYRLNDNGSPSGGSYNFTNSTLTVPTNWSTSVPTLTNDGDKVYQSVGLFTGAPTATAATVNGGSWSGVVLYSQRTDGEDELRNADFSKGGSGWSNEITKADATVGILQINTNAAYGSDAIGVNYNGAVYGSNTITKNLDNGVNGRIVSAKAYAVRTKTKGKYKLTFRAKASSTTFTDLNMGLITYEDTGTGVNDYLYLSFTTEDDESTRPAGNTGGTLTTTEVDLNISSNSVWYTYTAIFTADDIRALDSDATSFKLFAQRDDSTDKYIVIDYFGIDFIPLGDLTELDSTRSGEMDSAGGFTALNDACPIPNWHLGMLSKDSFTNSDVNLPAGIVLQGWSVSEPARNSNKFTMNLNDSDSKVGGHTITIGGNAALDDVYGIAWPAIAIPSSKVQVRISARYKCSSNSVTNAPVVYIYYTDVDMPGEKTHVHSATGTHVIGANEYGTAATVFGHERGSNIVSSMTLSGYSTNIYKEQSETFTISTDLSPRATYGGLSAIGFTNSTNTVTFDWVKVEFLHPSSLALLDSTKNTEIGTATTNVSAHNTRIGTAEGNITTNISSIGSHNTRIGTAEGNITSHNTRIGTTETNITSHNTRIGTTETNIGNIQKTVLSDDATQVSNVQGAVNGSTVGTSLSLNIAASEIFNATTFPDTLYDDPSPKNKIVGTEKRQYQSGIGEFTTQPDNLITFGYNHNLMTTELGDCYILPGTGKTGINVAAGGIQNSGLQVKQSTGSPTIGNSNLANSWLLVGTTTDGIGWDNNEMVKKGGDLFITTADANDIYIKAGNASDGPKFKSGGIVFFRDKVGISTGAEPNYNAALNIDCHSNANTSGINLQNVDNDWYIYTKTISGDNANLQFNADGTDYGYIDDGGSNDMMNFTGQHRCLPDSSTDLVVLSSSVGKIVVASGEHNNPNIEDKITINEAIPTVKLSTSENQKSVFGVVSDSEDPNEEMRTYCFGAFGTNAHKKSSDDVRVHINSVGEGAIWITNINGNLENGDYITTCEIPGYGMKQDTEMLCNYTVAKITMDCDFDLDADNYKCVEVEHSGSTYRAAFVGCTYHCG